MAVSVEGRRDIPTRCHDKIHGPDPSEPHKMPDAKTGAKSTIRSWQRTICHIVLVISRELLAWLAPAFLLPLVLKRRFEPMVAVRQWLLQPFGPFLGTVIKRQIDRHARFVLHLEVGAAFEHEESRLPAAIPDKVQQRCVASVVADIDVGAVVQEQAETDRKSVV